MEPQANNTMRRLLLLISCIFLAIGACGGPLIMRLYFIHGGKRIWLTSWLQTVGFPISVIPLAVSYMNRRKKHGSNAKIFLMNRLLYIASAIIGLLTGLVGYLSSFGSSKLPVSTSTLIGASQLAFTAAFAFLLVKQKFNAFSTNTIFLLTVGAAVLALRSSGDRPEGESNREYAMGFVLTILAAVTYGFILPSMELSYKKAKLAISYTLVMEYQMIMCIYATAFCTVGMLVNKDFQAISREAKAFDLGEVKYFVVLIASAIIWQCSFLGINGVIFCGSSLLCGILLAVTLPITEVLGVIFYNEKFTAEKGVALVLSLWGFISYFYGEVKYAKKETQSPKIDSQENSSETDIALVVRQ